MRGESMTQEQFLINFSMEDRVRADHPLRKIKMLADRVLLSLTTEFNRMYSYTGRPSIPPERLLKSQLLLALFSIRSDRLFCEMLDYNILFRWFLEMALDERSFDATSFTKNRERLMEQAIARKFFEEVVGLARKENLLSDEHFTVDGTLIEAWASMKSFQKKADSDMKRIDEDRGNPSVDFHGEKRRNETHQSTTDPEARLMRKGAGREAKLCYSGNALMENRSGLCVGVDVRQATGDAEREGAWTLIRQARRRAFRRMRTIGGDKGYCTNSFIGRLRRAKLIPHIARMENRRKVGLDGRTSRHFGYQLSQRLRKRIEEIFGWFKTVGGLRKTRFKGVRKVHEQAYWVASAYNLLRISKLQMSTP